MKSLNNKNSTRIFICFAFLLLCISIVAESPKEKQGEYELRGAWVATVVNIDWPSSASNSEEIKRDEIDKIIMRFRRIGINAVFLQVRPSYGTLYPSAIEPWSRFYTDKSQVITLDPLQYWIEQCHNNGMELHAWINPYRTLFSPTPEREKAFLSAQSHPEWYVKYGTNLYMDPGFPETRAYVVKLIQEIVTKYKDVDGIHFDDYFYPYKVAGKEYDDNASYNLYGKTFPNKSDWRRNNVNNLIRDVHNYLATYAPDVKFGVSPFGVWRNDDGVAIRGVRGSDTKAGVTSYDDLYADVLYWSTQKWIDYLAPQIYWPIGFNLADYKKLAHWWNDNVHFGDVYVGQATYKLDAQSKLKQWKNANELKKQIEINRNLPRIKGNIFYNTSSIMNNLLSFNEVCVNDVYSKYAIVPPMSWKIQESTQPISNQTQEIEVPEKLYTPVMGHLYYDEEGMHIKWLIERNPRSYMITRQRVNVKGFKKGSEEIIATLPGDQENYIDKTMRRNKYYKYRMVAVGKNSVNSDVVTAPVVRAKK